MEGEITKRWGVTSLLDILKEADLRINFTRHFKSAATREVLEREILQKRLLLCLYGLGTNTGLKPISQGDHGQTTLMKAKKNAGSCRVLRQPSISRTNNRFRPASDLQLAENAGDMIADRLRTQHQAFSNRRVGISLGKQGQDLPFTLG